MSTYQWKPSYGTQDCECLADRLMYDHHLFKLYESTYRMRDHQGQWTEPFTHVRLNLGDVVVMLCHDVSTDQFILVEQCRPHLKYAAPDISPWNLEVPAGYIEPQESPRQAALREAMEETGVRASSARLLVRYISSGLLCGFVHGYYLTVDCREVLEQTGVSSENEYIRTHVLDFESLTKLVRDGTIIGTHTLMLYYSYVSQIRHAIV